MGNTGVGKEDDRNDGDVDYPKAGVDNRGMAMERNGGTNAWTERLEPVEYFLDRRPDKMVAKENSGKSFWIRISRKKLKSAKISFQVFLLPGLGDQDM